MGKLLLLAALSLPMQALTPGVVRTLTTKQVCQVAWGRDARHVTEAMKRQVAKAYGMSRQSIVARGKGPCCEIDHRVPREIGGADDVRNLWPQPWEEAQRKDALENAVHRAVCSGKMTLAKGQAIFLGDWSRLQ